MHPAPATTPLAPAALAAALDAMGTPDFGAALLAALVPPLQAVHLTVFRFDAALSARVVLTAGLDGGRVAARSARVYGGSGLYRHDRLLAALRRPATAAGKPLLLRTRRQDITEAAYGAQLWDRHGLVDRLSALDGRDGPWTSINLYRDHATGPFGRAEAGRFARLAPLLLALLRRHLGLLQPDAGSMATARRVPPEAAAALLQRLPVRLSAREREVCALTLAGHTRQGIALALGIAESSVATLRERAYRKLQIHGAAELFALCLPHATQATQATGTMGLTSKPAAD
jgi:DNA-binding CsgD family transcriptional regulator